MKLPKIRVSAKWAWTVGLSLTLTVAIVTRDRWWPHAQQLVKSTIARQRGNSTLDEHAPGTGGDEHAGHDHGASDANSLEVSQQAMGNIGLTPEYLRPVELETFWRTITVPGIVVNRPGRTRLEVSTPMSGVITHVHAVQGEAVKPGTLLFEIRITAEELVATQTELLKTVGDLDVENREIERLRDVTQSGAIASKTLLERQYAKDKLEVLLGAQREALRLQGLSEQQVNEIVQNRKLLRNLQILSPNPDAHSHDELRLTLDQVVPIAFQQNGPETFPMEPNSQTATPLILDEVLVHKGETVRAGTTLAVISDLSELYIEGRAFEQDKDLLSRSAQQGWAVTALFEGPNQITERVPGLELLYSANSVDIDSRTLKFFTRLPNQVVRETPSPNGMKFVEWKYRPGQRLQLQVPVEEWKNKIVLPVEAVAREGAESYVFQQNGGKFTRLPVGVSYRDQAYAVIANDGSIFPGDMIARRGAHQLLMALKNKSGGGVDPHAGHNH